MRRRSQASSSRLSTRDEPSERTFTPAFDRFRVVKA
jgi:hypothetical protein